MREKSYQIAEKFLTQEILNKWEKTIKEVVDDSVI